MILEAQGLRIHYGHGGWLEDIELAVAAGELLFIRCEVLQLGSVLLQALLGMAEVAQGEVRFGDADLLAPAHPRRLLELRRDIGMVYRERGLISLLNVEQNIALPLGYHYNVSRMELTAEVRGVARLLGIEALLGRGAEDLDEMQTRLVNLARELIRRPRLLLIDGLLEGMPCLCEQVIAAIRRYQARHGFGVIMTGRRRGLEFATRAMELREDGLVSLGE